MSIVLGVAISFWRDVGLIAGDGVVYVDETLQPLSNNASN
jgi:hypothetical protein